MDTRRSRRTHWCLLGGLLLSIIYWCSEAFLHSAGSDAGDFRMALLPLDNPHELWTRLFILSLFLTFSIAVDSVLARLRNEYCRSAGLVDELTRSLAEVKTLTGLLPICAVCKKVRDDTGYWHQVETYIRDHSNADFTHGYCPACADTVRREYQLTGEPYDTDRQCAVHQAPVRDE